MPDPAVVTVMRDYRRRLLSGEAHAMSQMATRWREVERALRSQTLSVAREIWRLQAAGTPVPRELLISLRHTQDLLGQVQKELDRYGDYADELIRARQADTMRLGIEAGTSAIQATAPTVQFSRLNVAAVENLVGLAGDGSPLRSVLQQAYGHGAEGILDVLVRGVAMGKSPRTMAAEAIRQGLSRSLQHMLTVMRTETLRTFRHTTMETYKQSQAVRGYRRLSARDRRCCVACIAMDGKEFPLTEPFASHPNCRCAMVPVIIGYEIDIGSGEKWFNRQPAEIQQAMLGPQRYELWKEGMAFDRFSVRREDARWGASYVPATLRELTG